MSRGSLCLLALATAAIPIAGQVLPTFASKAEIVVLSASAVDEKGRPVTDLRRGEMRVFENGRLQPIVHFAEGALIPARILLLVDASGSMTGELKTSSSRMAAIQMLHALSPEDQVALAAFDSRYYGIVAWTKDKAKIEEGLKKITSFGATALHDALDRAAQDLASHGEGRRAVVVITDGLDTASRATADAVIERSRALDVPIYSLNVVSPLDDPRSKQFLGRIGAAASTAGSALLERYAALSGGGAFVVSDFAGLKKAAGTVALEIKHQYRLAYDPPQGPQSFRRVEVRTTRKGVLIRTRSGYVPKA